MLAEFDFHGLALTDLIIVGGVIGLIIREVADFRGWSRSSRTLRRENEDLVRRNGELEQTVARHEQDIERLRTDVDRLRELNRELEKTNLAAAITKIGEHEVNAVARHHENAVRGEQQLAVQQQTLETVASAVTTLVEIRDTLKQGGTA